MGEEGQVQLEGSGHKEKKGGEVPHGVTYVVGRWPRGGALGCAAGVVARIGARMHARQKNGGGEERGPGQDEPHMVVLSVTYSVGRALYSSA